MNPADWVILAIVILMALQGYARGFLVGVASLAGFVIGALIGGRLAPLLLSQGARSPYAPLFALAGALLLGAMFGGLLEGVARRMRRLVWFPPLRIFDGLAGALLGAAVGFGLAWVAGAALLQAASAFNLPQGIRADLRGSSILRALDSALPPSGPILNALGRVDPLPIVTGRVAAVPAPDPGIVSASGVLAARASVVRVIGTACGLGIEGSGWVIAPDLVMTNAHVVAGESATLVQVRGRAVELPARAVVFDPHNDVALLRVTGLGLPALALAANPAAGQSGAILGYPLDGPFDAQPGRLGQTQFTATQDAYGRPTVREISSLRGLVRPGNSGGPLVDAAGAVLATVFAQVTNAPPGEPGGFAIPDSVARTELDRAQQAQGFVGTGGCAS